MSVEIRVHAEESPAGRWQVVAAVKGTSVRFHIERWEDGDWHKCDVEGETGGEAAVFAQCEVPPADEPAIEALVTQCLGHIKQFQATAAQEQHVASIVNQVADSLRTR